MGEVIDLPSHIGALYLHVQRCANCAGMAEKDVVRLLGFMGLGYDDVAQRIHSLIDPTVLRFAIN